MNLQILYDEARQMFPELQAVRRDLHMHPETAYEEVRTAGIVARTLTELGLEVTTGVAKTGVVALLEGEHPGPVVLIRADMDALPIQEGSEKEYSSRVPGKMHACGHDGHVSVGLAVAKILSKHRSDLHGTIKFVFQPAEEGMNGAQAMIDTGVLENPVPDACLALHLWSSRPVGWVSFTSGPIMAGADFFSVHISGKGGHGAIPHQAIDPLFAAAQIAVVSKTLVSANISAMENAVLTVTSFQAGETYNVIPSKAELRGTMRTFTPGTRKRLIEAFERLLTSTAAATGCSATWEDLSVAPPVVNDAKTAGILDETARQIAPDLKIDNQYQSMVSEDMALMLARVPGCYFIVGAANDELGLNYPHHHPKFDIDENALPIAAGIMAAGAARLLGA